MVPHTLVKQLAEGCRFGSPAWWGPTYLQVVSIAELQHVIRLWFGLPPEQEAQVLPVGPQRVPLPSTPLAAPPRGRQGLSLLRLRQTGKRSCGPRALCCRYHLVCMRQKHLQATLELLIEWQPCCCQGCWARPAAPYERMLLPGGPKIAAKEYHDHGAVGGCTQHSVGMTRPLSHHRAALRLGCQGSGCKPAPSVLHH